MCTMAARAAARATLVTTAPPPQDFQTAIDIERRDDARSRGHEQQQLHGTKHAHAADPAHGASAGHAGAIDEPAAAAGSFVS